jgi:hypothetical protein
MLTDFNQELTMKKVILASLLATMMGTSPVWAADNDGSASAATAQVQKEAADVTGGGSGRERDARRPVRPSGAVHGQPESAKKLTDDAAALLDDDASWAKFVKTDATAKMIADRYVVINATIALSEDYVATRKKRVPLNLPTKNWRKAIRKGLSIPCVWPVLA